MQVSNCKNGMQDSNENNVKKVNKKMSNTKMSKSQKVAASSNTNSTPETYRESPQNVRLDTSDSDEESVSEESFPQDQDDISTEEFPEDESCESENDEQDEDVSDEEEESSNPDNSDDESDVTDEEHPSGPSKKFLLDVDDDLDQLPQFSKQARIDALIEAAAASKEKKSNPVLQSATAALDEAAQTITRMRSDASPRDKNLLSRTLIAACTDNDVNAVRRLLVEGNSLNDATDDGDSLLSLACSAGYYELAQVLLAMSAQVEDRGQKNDCTPLMEAASAGHIEIIELLIRHGADVNAQSSTGNTPLMYACAGGHVEAVKTLLSHGANVEDHNENGHTPLMEAASAGHVAVAKILLDHGAGINTHSNEFKESALTLACYKGHLDMVRFLLEAGADQEHKTDEMHTALMEASMDGHVEVARLLLDSGAQVNMPTDSFESPLTLAACGGHVDLAMLLIERGANIEEVNDEGYTPLMEAAREGHDEMVSLLLTQGANINAQTEETQETALTLACCGGFLEVADYLIKHGADIELGASTPLMEAAQEGHLDLVKFLLENKADVHAQTQTGDTALTYACENGHTDVAEVLLYFGAELEHLSEGGRTPLMKACRAGHICTVKFLIQKGADVNRQTTNNDHTPLSLACAGGHQQVVELLLAHVADPFHKLKDNSTMLIEAAKGGHTGVVQLLLDYPTSIPPQQSQQNQPIYIPAPMPHQTPHLNMAQMKHQQQQQLKMLQQQQQQQHLMAQQAQQQFMVAPPGLHDVTEVIRLPEPPGMFQPQADMVQNQNFIIDPNTMAQSPTESSILTQLKLLESAGFKDGLAYGLTKAKSAVDQMVNQQTTNNMNVAPCANQHQPMITNNLCMASSSNKQKNVSRKKCSSGSFAESQTVGTIEVRSAGVGEEEENVTYIKSSLDKLDNTLQKNIQFINDSGPPPTLLPSGTYVDITTPAQGKGNISVSNQTQTNQIQSTNKSTHITAKSEVSQATAISDRPKAKPKNSRKLQAQQKQAQSDTIVLTSSFADLKPTLVKAEAESQQQEVFKIETLQEVPQMVPEASSTAILSPDERDKASDGARACSLIDLETFQKMRPNNLSNRSALWDPKVFRKIAQLIDPPKSPTETPPHSSNSSRPNSPDAKNLASDMAELTHIFDHLPALQSLSADPNLLQGKFKNREKSKEDLEKTLATLSEMNASDFGCHETYPSLEESLESFNPDDVSGVNPGDDAHGPIYNYEWVDEVMQALNVSPDISNAFHEIAANINNQDLEQYANFFGLNQICKTKWASPHWPPTQHQMTSESSSPTNEIDENLILQDEDGKEDDPNLLMTIDQSGYPPQFTVEQLQFISQLQQQHQSLLQIDPQTAQNILVPTGRNFLVPAPPIIASEPGQTQKTQADAQQQTKFVFNVDNDKTSQSLQLLFQLPTDGQQQQQQQILKAPDGAQKMIHQNVAQTQTMNAAGVAQPVQVPSIINHQQGFLNFQLQQQQQQQQQQQPGIQMNQQIVSANIQQQQQKVHQVPQFMNKNYQQVQVATQTQMMGTQTQSHVDAVQHPTTSNKSTNVSVTIGKKTTGGEQKRKEKSRYALRQAPTGQNQYQYDQQLQQYANIPGSTSTGTTTDRTIEIDSETESNHDTALTLACAGGHEELVDLLLNRKANIEHRDKKGFTPLILAATAGHEKVVETLINNGADLEAQSERTKDTPLSLACSGGRYEVVELLLKYGANKEHRNVSDYTPLSLAASGGYVNIIKLLLNHGAEINSRTGSKLGISPLMLAAMNGHTAAVRLLLDMGSDINAQIETNRNTALTLACFQGRNEVVNLLLDRKANVEHRAKTGLTPLMEAASGGYIEVGRVLLDKGADVNAAPVPSSRDTALTIAADKGHLKFVDLLLSRGASVEVKNKKGNSPLWLAANGGHLGVVEALYHAKADIDSQDNRKVSCLMAAFRKGHIKVVKWMVNHVAQFPSDQEMTRYISVVDKEVVDKCHECVKIIRAAKETQAAKANINASILLKELDMEKSREDARKAAAAKRRERKKRRKQEKREAQRKLNGNDTPNEGKNANQKGKALKNDEPDTDESEEESNDEEEVEEIEHAPVLLLDKEEGDSGIDQGSCSSSDAKGATTSKNQVEPENVNQNSKNQKNQKRKKNQPEVVKPASGKASSRSSSSPVLSAKLTETVKTREDLKRNRDQKVQRSADLTIKSIKPFEKENVAPKEPQTKPAASRESKSYENSNSNSNSNSRNQHRKSMVFGNSRSSAGADDYEIDYFKVVSTVVTSAKPKTTTSPTKATSQAPSSVSAKQPREEEWKEVGRKPATSTSTAAAAPTVPPANEIGCKKIQVPLNAISRVIGRGGSNINAIRAATGAHIEVEKQGKTQGDRSITIKGVAEATKQAHNLISTLIKDPDADILSMLPRNNFQPVKSSSSTNVAPAPAPATQSVNNNGTSVWEKSLNTIPTVQNPVKPASFAAASKTASSGVAKSVTPTQLNNKSQRSSVAKNLFAVPSGNIMRPTPSSGKILIQDNSKKGMVATNGPPSKPATSIANSIQALKNSIANAPTATVITSQASTASSSGTFASKLSGSNDNAASNVGKKSSASSPTKQLPIGSGASTSSLPAPFINSVSTSSMSGGGLVQTVSDPIVSSTPATITRSITPIGPPTRNINASPHSSHIVNTLDLSTPYHNTSSHNDFSAHHQSKLGELHVSAQGLEYSLFDNYGKWSQDKPMVYNPLKVSASYMESEPLQADASKAPGYRGTSINSPVSSKTSSNSATPPSTTLASQAPTSGSSTSHSQSGNASFDMNVIKPIGQGPIQPPGPVQRPSGGGSNRMDMNFARGQTNLFDYGNNEASYGSINYAMNQQPNVNASMSRLNPKASAFSSSSASTTGGQNQNKINSNQYGSNFMTQNNNNNFMKSPGSNSGQQGYQRSSVNQPAASSRWFQEYGSYGGQGMDFSGTSPSMSPNNNNNSQQSANGPIDDSRKAPAPIGNERSYKYYGGSGYGGSGGQNLLDMDASAMMNNPSMAPGRNNSWMEKNQQQWQMQSNISAAPRGPYDQPSEYPMQDIFQYQMDTTQQQMNYMRGVNGQTSFHPNAPFIGGSSDLANLSSDLQQSSYEFDKQPWPAKWTH